MENSLRRKARLCVYFKKWCCDVSFITAVCVNGYIVIDKSKYLVAKPWLLTTNNFMTNFVFGFVIVYMLFHTCAHAHRTLCVELTRCNKTLFCLLPWISSNLIHHDSILQHDEMLCVCSILYLWFLKRNFEYQAGAYPAPWWISVKRDHDEA